MNHSVRVIRWPWRSRPRMACTAAAVIGTVGLTLLAAACSSSSPSSGGSDGPANAGGATSSALAASYSQCMRSHGVPAFPDPDSSGTIPKITSGQQVGVSDSQLNAAEGTCQHLWPYQPSNQAQQQQQVLANDLKFARCMRSHGVPNWPDPTNGPHGPRFVISVSKDGFDPHSAQIAAKAQQCMSVLPAGSGLPLTTVTS